MYYLDSSLANKAEFVSCGSMIKLLNVKRQLRLHSHDIKYGSGSGQQSVTGTSVGEDVNSHWIIKGENGSLCTRGEPIKCGMVINLEHSTTNRNLHTHYFQSPLSGYQEISCYGDNGVGDVGDNWKVLCSGSHWRRDTEVYFKHVSTAVFLCATDNKYGRPISDQYEIAGGYKIDSCASEWKAAEGIFIKPGVVGEFKIDALHDPGEL